MSGTNVGQLNVGIGMSTEQLETDSAKAQKSVDNMLSGVGAAVEKLKTQLQMDDALDNLVLNFRKSETAAKAAAEAAAKSRMADMGSTAYRRDPMIEKLSAFSAGERTKAYHAEMAAVESAKEATHQKDVSRLRFLMSMYDQRTSEEAAAKESQHQKDVQRVTFLMSMYDQRAKEETAAKEATHQKDVSRLTFLAAMYDQRIAEEAAAKEAAHQKDVQRVTFLTAMHDQRIAEESAAKEAAHQKDVARVNFVVAMYDQRAAEEAAAKEAQHQKDVSRLNFIAAMHDQRVAEEAAAKEAEHQKTVNRVTFLAAMADQKLREEAATREAAQQKLVASQGVIETIRRQQAEAQAARAQDGAHLKWSLLTEKERFAVRKQADLDHLAMLLRFKAITDDDFQKMAGKAGTLGLGNVPGDNNMRNSGFQGAMLAQQLGFGMQDFASQVMNSRNGIEGIGRGVMALSNNVQMMGGAFGATTLAVTAIGGALASIIIPLMINWLSNSKKLEESIENYKKDVSDINDLLKMRFELEVKGSGEKPVEKLRTLEQEAEMADKMLERERERTKLAEWWLALAKEGNPMAGGAAAVPELREKLKLQKEAEETARKDAFKANDKADIFAQQTLFDRMAEEQEQKNKLDDEIAANRLKAAEEEGVKVREELALTNKLKEEDAKKARDAVLATMDEAIAVENDKQEKLHTGMDLLKEQGITPNGPSAMSVAGSSAAASAINRALTGGRSEESDRKKQIKIMEDQLKSTQKIEKNLAAERQRLAKADLTSA